jgi:hypothetical protein
MNDESAGFVVLNATDKDCADIFVIGIKNSIKWVLDQYLTKLTKLRQGSRVMHIKNRN